MGVDLGSALAPVRVDGGKDKHRRGTLTNPGSAPARAAKLIPINGRRAQILPAFCELDYFVAPDGANVAARRFPNGGLRRPSSPEL
jgi:hypothetical protein